MLEEIADAGPAAAFRSDSRLSKLERQRPALKQNRKKMSRKYDEK